MSCPPKGIEVRTRFAALAVLILSVLAGCKTTPRTTGPAVAEGAAGSRVLLAVDFQQGQTLRYRFVSDREIILDWDPDKSSSKSGKSSVNNYFESLEMVVAYTPLEVDEYGLTKIKATCTLVKTSRTKSPASRGASSTDAVTTVNGRSFVFTVAPSGRIQDYSELDKLVREAGEKAFRSDTSHSRVKEPDMIGDFIASQWFLWDSVSSIPNPSAGVAVGQTWSSQLSVPVPMVLRQARDVTYTLNEIRPSTPERQSAASGTGPTETPDKFAVIAASYKLPQPVPSGSGSTLRRDESRVEGAAPHNWPIPYSGRFQMSGTFGFLGPYEILDLKGRGEELFNIDAGRLEKSSQQYTVQMKASLPPLGIRANPHITINQKLTMDLLH